MNLSVGIVGLPNVGKSTLFNALLKKQQALAANYPFATIEPNVGIVPVPDARLQKLAEISKEEEKMSSLPPIKPAMVNFVDIAGLVKGASEGAGLGNKFLSHIREVSVIAHVVRAFEDSNIIREGSVDAKSDYETINTELLLADMQTVISNKQKEKSRTRIELLERVSQGLNRGIAVRDMQFTNEEKEEVKQLFLLSSKPEVIVLNVSENQINQSTNQLINQFSNKLNIESNQMVVICAKIESELSELSEDEQKEYLQNLGLQESGLERLIRKAYETLGLISFLTAGDKEVRAWTLRRGSTALSASGEIHTDFMKAFIKAEVVSFEDFVSLGGWKKARELGKARFEGRDYVMKDGDVVEFKIGS